jgi:hypothetical protein
MSALNQHGTRIAVTLIPLLLALLHAVGVWPMGAQLKHLNEEKVLYRLFSQRLAIQKALPFDPTWDGTTTFDVK